MSIRTAGRAVTRELARTGVAVIAVAAVILIYQGCSQPVEPIADQSAPGAVDAQAEQPDVEVEVEVVESAQADEEVLESAQADEEVLVVAQAEEAGHDMPQLAGVELPRHAIAIIAPTDGNTASGWVKFVESNAGTTITAEISGLAPGMHGFHIHEFGDISAPDGTSAGGHFNPMTQNHGAPNADPSHVGDLGNIEAGEDGAATYNVTFPTMKVHYVVGRAMIVHADADDLKTQPTGNAGARVGMGVIGIAKGE